MNQKEMLERLVENALDFLNQSLVEFEKFPKYSVIHFYAGVELFLKARLMAEHWTLVVAKNPDWEKFELGDFVSVSLGDAIDRLRKVVRQPFAPQEIEIFDKLRKHRNKAMHFFHEAHTGKRGDALRQIIVQEQLRAWYLLQKLLTERWSDIFLKWKTKFHAFSVKLNKQKEYLQVVFEQLEPEIKRFKLQGSKFKRCPSCNFFSQKIESMVGELQDTNCLVCKHKGRCLTIECSDCGTPVTFIDEGFGECAKCKKSFQPEDLVKLLSKSNVPYKRELEMDTGLPAHCKNCDGRETVVEFYGDYLCACCLELYEKSEMNRCEWCNELNAGNMEASYLMGCVACEGQSGWHKDDPD